MSKHLWPALSLAIALSGCATAHPDYSAMGPSMNARRYASLQKLATRDTNCPAERLQHEYLGEDRHMMRGCNTNVVYELNCIARSCGWVGDVRLRAAYDLNCPHTEIKVSPLGNNTRAAAGCGKRAVYQKGRGAWNLSTAVTDDPSAGASTAGGGGAGK